MTVIPIHGDYDLATAAILTTTERNEMALSEIKKVRIAALEYTGKTHPGGISIEEFIKRAADIEQYILFGYRRPND